MIRPLSIVGAGREPAGMPLARRLQALILTLVFLGGGSTLPSADVLLHHLRGKPIHVQAHFEPLNGCGAHADHCRINRPTSTTGALGALPVTVSAEAAQTVTSPLPAGDFPPPAANPIDFHSRAPPLLNG